MEIDKIYILKRRKLIRGPYSLDKLKEKGVYQTDLVWYEGLEDWTPPNQIRVLQSYILESKQLQQSLFSKIFSFLR